MTDAHDRLGVFMSGRAPEALIAALVLTRLVVEGGELGELATRLVPTHDGDRREVKTVPLEWLNRLATAAERGALTKYTVEQIVQHILSRPAGTVP